MVEELARFDSVQADYMTWWSRVFWETMMCDDSVVTGDLLLPLKTTHICFIMHEDVSYTLQRRVNS